MDNAMHFFDEIKKGMQHQVEQAIEDWDYQDFSPDKRRALLEEQVTNDVADDLQPESDAIQHIHDSRQQLNWSGLSPEDELADYDCGSDGMAADATGYESKVVIMSTPAGGIQGVPDADTLYRFMNKAQHAMGPQALTQALVSRLQDPNRCWQIRSKVLVLMHALIESVPLAPHYLPLFKQSIQMMQLVEKLRTSDHNHIVRENARKALSLVQSNGANPMLIPREASVPKQPHTHHAASELTSVRKSAKFTSSSANTATAKRVMKTQPPPAAIKVNHHRQQDAKDNKHLHTSPKIARAALASWRRRNSQGSQDETGTSQDKPNLLPFQRPPQMTMQSKQQVAMANNSNGGFGAGESPHITTSSSSNASRYQSGQMSAFTFIQ